MSEKKRQKRSLREKYDIINEFESGVSRELIISGHHLKSRSHLNEIIKNKEKIVNNYEKLYKNHKKTVSYVSKAKFGDLEEALILWLRQVRTRKLSVNTEMIKGNLLA